MCGIIGIIGKSDVSPLLIQGLKRLEYRGYDSAGIATLFNGELVCRRAEGKLIALENEVRNNPIAGTTGIGHTRWATHGRASAINAHPHHTDKVAVVHNGIIENFRELRAELESNGIVFKSETDTEVIPQLITFYLEQGLSPQDATAVSLKRLTGAFAISVLFKGIEKFMIAARRGSPLAIGYGDGEMYVGSDAFSLAPLTSRISYLQDGDWAELSENSITIYDEFGNRVEREIKVSALSGQMAGKDNYDHYMLKEIYEQPKVIDTTLHAYYNSFSRSIQLPKMPFQLEDVAHLTIVACGTSYYAGSIAKYWIEKFAGIPVSIDIASEFRYRNAILPKQGMALFISQSGETADTMAALKFARSQGQHIVSLVNAEESSMAHASDVVLRTYAGTEVGVASTKAFTTQLVVLACLALAMGEAKKTLSAENRSLMGNALLEAPTLISQILNYEAALKTIAASMVDAPDVIYIGRGTSYSVALEGALKLKELSYIHAEGIAAGELKHGPIALVDETVPVICIAPSDELFEKTASNIEEVAARRGKVIAITDASGARRLKSLTSHIIEIPSVHPFVAPLLYTIPVQLLAYHIALLKGHDVDKPRNLAKSVTVE
jgi:glucosamine--fructose-6-phosphate aminotransferase (isomerizing)